MQTQQDPPRPQAHPCQELLLPASGGEGPRRPSPRTELPTYNNNPKNNKTDVCTKVELLLQSKFPNSSFQGPEWLWPAWRNVTDLTSASKIF